MVVLNEKEVEKVKKYERVKGRLQIRLWDPDGKRKPKEELVKVFTGIFDVTYHVIIMENDEETISVGVTNELLKTWGISTLKLHSDALEAEARRGAILTNLEEALESMVLNREPVNMLEETMDFRKRMTIVWMLTNKKRLYGAGMILNDDIMKKVREAIGEDFYIIPASVHETILIRESLLMSESMMRDMIREVNSTEVEADEEL